MFIYTAVERSHKVLPSFCSLIRHNQLILSTPISCTAKAYAEKGRTHVNSGLAKADQQWSQRQAANNASSSSENAHSPGLTGGAPPLPPSRSTGGPPPPPSSRNRAYSGTSSSITPTSSGFSFANLPQSEKTAFFALLDEYFSTRPQFESFFTGTTAQEIENLSSFPRRGPLPPPTSTPTPVAAPPPPVPTPAARTLGTCTALYDYEPTDSGDLAFSEGDRITLIEIGTSMLFFTQSSLRAE